ncbi:hypothetical protein FLK61_35305 [Paenalkalicoccus suaedae]|uniref:Phage protein n=1 Tax=Paenalkalicoccus suaedae TaxID=2592382 RepID=A0A859FFQ6_9BACI|nr:hypothetical protein [Paenalkalicoccus suaedae]QKS71937.1 hypothetical protein FLK61_35305 [Paenalkalicoccus suaedae]
MKTIKYNGDLFEVVDEMYLDYEERTGVMMGYLKCLHVSGEFGHVTILEVEFSYHSNLDNPSFYKATLITLGNKMMRAIKERRKEYAD